MTEFERFYSLILKKRGPVAMTLISICLLSKPALRPSLEPRKWRPKGTKKAAMKPGSPRRLSGASGPPEGRSGLCEEAQCAFSFSPIPFSMHVSMVYLALTDRQVPRAADLPCRVRILRVRGRARSVLPKHRNWHPAAAALALTHTHPPTPGTSWS